MTDEPFDTGSQRAATLLARRMKIALRSSVPEPPARARDNVSKFTTTPGKWAEHVSAGRWKMYRHHAVLDKELLALANGKNRRLIVQEPPRHGKSEHGSRYFPAWFLGKFPTKHIILASATDELAADFSGAARDLLLEHGERYFDVHVRRDKQAAHRWALEEGGSMRAVGVGGGVMGRGADGLIIDDYFGKLEEALSETERRKRHRWFHATVKTRLSPTGWVLIIATRYHPKDVIGELLEEAKHGGDEWNVIRFPAIAEENDQLGRKPGEALWPEQWSVEQLLQMRASYNASGYPWMFEALYQQNPPDVLDAEWPAEYFGEHIWFDKWPAADRIVCKVMSIDPSLGKSDKSDYSAIIMLAKDRDGHYWIEADIARRPSARIVEDGLAWHRGFKPTALGCETNQFQDLLHGQFEARAEELRESIWFCGINNHTPKRVRIRTLTPHLAKRRIHIRRGSGGSLLVEQLKGFPSHKFDDGPDGAEMGVRLVEAVLQGAVQGSNPSEE